MNMQDLVTWIGAASGSASLVTLVYLSIQVRQNNLLMRAGARQAQVDTDQDHIRKFIEYPDIAASFASAGPITEEARIRLNFWIVASLRAREYEWLQYTSGALDEATWASYQQLIPFVLGTPRARRYWALCAGFFNPAFVRVVEAMIDGQPLTSYWEALAAAD
jgi:hypothetical protein